MMSPQQTQTATDPFTECANVSAIDKKDSNLVFCYRVQRWVDFARCSSQCSPEDKSTQASQEW